MKKGWQKKRLGDVTTKIGSGATPRGGDESYKAEGISLIRSLNVYDDGFREAKLARIDDEQADDLSNVVVEPHDVLLNITGASVARCCRAPADFLPARVNQHVSIIRPVQQKLDSDFLHYLLISKIYKDRLLHTGEEGGSTRQAITKAQLQEFFVEFPDSLAEQQRIVGLLDEAFEGLATAKANAEKNLQNARALFESHLQSVFTQRGPGWVDRQLASLCHEITVGHVGSMKTEYKESGVPFLRSQNIRPFEVSMENVMFIDETFHRALKKSQLRPGDLAIVRTGYPGTAAVIPPELPDSNCSDLVIVRPSKEVNPHFLAAFFNSAFGKQLVLGKIVGAAQKHFNITAAKEVMLHVPPMAEQRTIIAMVDNLREETQRLAHLYERKHAALAALKKSLLHQAFTGEL